MRAARTLYCHRNTVLNRLQRVQALTSLDVHNAAIWPQLMLGLSALRQIPTVGEGGAERNWVHLRGDDANR